MKKCPSLIGQKFGMLTVIDQAAPGIEGKRRWICRCDCGSERVVFDANLKRGSTVSCGCRKRKDLTGQKIGRLTVLERSEKYATRGKRRQRLWRCVCDCGEITYKATDTLTNPDISMCQRCAREYAITQARENLGFEDGTQLTKIRICREASDNLSGVRGVYLDRKTGRYRARLVFRGNIYDLGSYRSIEDAVKARRLGEEEIYGSYLSAREELL